MCVCVCVCVSVCVYVCVFKCVHRCVHMRVHACITYKVAAMMIMTSSSNSGHVVIALTLQIPPFRQGLGGAQGSPHVPQFWPLHSVGH